MWAHKHLPFRTVWPARDVASVSVTLSWSHFEVSRCLASVLPLWKFAMPQSCRSAPRSLWLACLVHIPWFAGYCLLQWGDCDRHFDVQAMANTQIIFVICAVTLLTVFHTKRPHSRDVASVSAPWSSVSSLASDNNNNNNNNIHICIAPYGRNFRGAGSTCRHLCLTSVLWVSALALISAWKASCTSLSVGP